MSTTQSAVGLVSGRQKDQVDYSSTVFIALNNWATRKTTVTPIPISIDNVIISIQEKFKRLDNDCR